MKGRTMDIGKSGTIPPPVVKPKNAQPPQLAASKRQPRDPNLAPLTDKQRFVLGQVRAAGRACKLLAKQLDNGRDISPAAAVACSTLAAEYSASI